MSNQQTRAFRINKLCLQIDNAIKSYSDVYMEELIASLMMDYGMSRRTSIEYVKTAVYALKLQTINGKVLKPIPQIKEEQVKL